ncbi:hypothetical protein GCM10010149_89160 [Nonomuraea roseoviolacea subsp. roseoviolacea]|uniref:hypothetical protein n=1 Tax=Nonomuraea roseoviolacea TaxID=103837 RepID=UPI0031D49BCC
MALYANYVPNPTFELATTGWTNDAGTGTRVGSNAANGTYSLKITMSGSQNSFGGVLAVVPVTPDAGPYTLSMNIGGATENHGATYSAGTRITVFDLLPGQAVGLRQQLKTQTFSRATVGRVALRNFTPRATADRIVILVETASTYYKDPETSTQSSGLVWTYTNLSSASSGIRSPSGRYVDNSEWDNYANTGYSLSGLQTFVYEDTFSNLRYNARSGTFTKTTVTSPAVSGGTSTVYIDAVQLEQGTIETTYVDGATPGYVWAGAPHNSATLNMVPLQASGSASMSGPDIDMLILRYLQSGGGNGLTGTAQLSAEGTVRATGTPMGLTGTLSLWRRGPVSAAGASSMVGGSQVYAIVPIEAHGTMGAAGGANQPKAQARIAWDLGGATGGAMSMSGSVDVTFPQPISASGDMTMDGTGRAQIGWQLISHGAMSMSGLAQLDDAVPKGAFADFVIYSTSATDSDPLKLGRGGSNAGTTSGANGAAWNRIHAEFYAPADQPVSGGGYAWRRAQYAAVGFKFAAVPAANYQELTCVQLEPSSADNSPGPRTYKTAKTIEPLVWADRINYSVGDAWVFFGSTGLTVTNGGASPITNDPNPIRNLTIASASASGFFGSNIVAPPPGTRCIASFYLKGDGNIPSIEAKILANDTSLTTLGKSAPTPLPNGQWVRVEIPFISGQDEQFFCIAPPADVLAYPTTLQIAGFMVEQGVRVGDYMNFIAGTTDYFYRYNGSDKTKGVFLYRNIGERIPLLTAALAEHAPLSVRVAEPQFGLVPNLD